MPLKWVKEVIDGKTVEHYVPDNGGSKSSSSSNSGGNTTSTGSSGSGSSSGNSGSGSSSGESDNNEPQGSVYVSVSSDGPLPGTVDERINSGLSNANNPTIQNYN